MIGGNKLYNASFSLPRVARVRVLSQHVSPLYDTKVHKDPILGANRKVIIQSAQRELVLPYTAQNRVPCQVLSKPCPHKLSLQFFCLRGEKQVLKNTKNGTGPKGERQRLRSVLVALHSYISERAPRGFASPTKTTTLILVRTMVWTNA